MWFTITRDNNKLASRVRFSSMKVATAFDRKFKRQQEVDACCQGQPAVTRDTLSLSSAELQQSVESEVE